MSQSLKVLELFAGIGACSKALTNLGIEHEIVDAVEIDNYAIKSFNAIHGTNFEPQDITKWDKDIECDLIMHGSPCQDFSTAGKQAGGDKGSGTRSSLMYETLRIVEKLKPQYVIWENVKNLLSKKHRANYFAYIEAMDKLGYKNYGRVLNAKDYGIPQNRERVFTVSIRERERTFGWPSPQPLERKLADMLEEKVEENYYLSDKILENYFLKEDTGKYPRKERFLQNILRDNKGIGNTVTTRAGSRVTDNFITEPFIVASRGRNPENPSDRTSGFPTEQRLEPNTKGVTNTITSVQKDNYVAVRTANRQGYDLATNGDGIDLAYPDSQTRRGRVGHGVSKTIPTSSSQGVLELTGENEMEFGEVYDENYYEERYKESREILPILRQKIGEEAFCEWAIRGLWCILSESVLWERVYAKGIFENWVEQPELVKRSYFCKADKPIAPTKDIVRNMWCDWQDRYTPYRRELSEQQFEQLKSVVQKLPHEVASFKGFVQGLWEGCKGVRILQQALSEIQKIWQSNACWKVQRPSYRIRKLTPLSCWRLMGFDDADFDKAKASGISNSQLYKQAGNSIVVNVLQAILTNLLKEEYARQ